MTANATGSSIKQNDVTQDFLAAAKAAGALKFGSFTLKSGRQSPYFFNAGLFSTARTQAALAQAYADTLVGSGLAFDMLFGPAYKGITLAATTAVALFQRHHIDVGFCYNRKETKDHGEGGRLVGAPLKGRVVIVDDVISAGTSVRESIEIIRQAGAAPCGVLIALDRCERGADLSIARSAAQEVTAQFGIPVLAVAKLADLLTFVRSDPALLTLEPELQRYRDQYGVD
jgi:orotate phosphoribosyltransferase